MVINRWRSERNKSGIAPIERPLITSTEWMQIQAHEKIGRPERQSIDKEKQLVLVEHVCLPLRRPVRGSTEGKSGNLKQRESIPECGNLEEGRDFCKLNRGNDLIWKKRRLRSWGTAIDL